MPIEEGEEDNLEGAKFAPETKAYLDIKKRNIESIYRRLWRNLESLQLSKNNETCSLLLVLLVVCTGLEIVRPLTFPRP